MSSRTPIFALALCLIAAPLPAHEIGTTRVTISLPGDLAYDVEIVTDAAALAEKLQASSGAPPAADTRPARLQSLLTASGETFRGRVTLAFDNPADPPSVAFAVKPGIDALSAPVATIHLTGHVPPHARALTWNYGWTFASYALTVRAAGARPATEWLEGNHPSAPILLAAPPPAVDRLGLIRRYLMLGFTHILPNGIDHMLFVLGIYLLSGRARTVLSQVSAFTVAHSITLGLSMYGVLSLSPRIVEPMIAISIAYVAIENLFLSELKSWRIALVFVFGLLHGMGFAGALRELGLPRSEFLAALLTFNVGVEAGQLAVIVAAFLLVGWHCANRVWYRSRIVVPASLVIACTAIYWTVQRLSA